MLLIYSVLFFFKKLGSEPQSTSPISRHPCVPASVLVAKRRVLWDLKVWGSGFTHAPGFRASSLRTLMVTPALSPQHTAESTGDDFLMVRPSSRGPNFAKSKTEFPRIST